MHRLKINLQHDGVYYKTGTEVDLDAIGLDGKSMVAEGQAEPVLIGDDRPPGNAEPAASDETKLGSGAKPEGQTMSRKARGTDERE